ncbi:hypothetical protein [Lentibacter sp. XHP0401]|uniref:hypothetical protein n=1 Tax=Lentibacter sp. XHP0401 TaxID=2984334 RepID=UPI0021E8621B|nr:hypothetical protein [Lentibacter sp. XHP0401]MCV2895006.1 hypothetical protein [Lentibacter sp. XHP0401]
MFEDLRAIIAERIGNLEPDSRFNIRDLLGNEWPEEQGSARQIGRDFRANLATFPGVEDEGRDGANLRWYRKT